LQLFCSMVTGKKKNLANNHYFLNCTTFGPPDTFDHFHTMQ